MANIYEGVMNYEPTKARGWRPEAAPRVWDTLWGEAVEDNGEEEEVVVSAPVTGGVKWEDSKLKTLWDDLKKDFQKGFEEGQQQRAIDETEPWINPDTGLPLPGQGSTQQTTPYSGPSLDAIAGARSAAPVAGQISGDDYRRWAAESGPPVITGLNEPVDDSVVLEQLSINPNTPRVPAYPSQDYGATGANLGLFPTYPGVTPEVIEQTQNNIWESRFVPEPSQWDEQERIDEDLAQNAERIRSEQAARKRDQARATRLEVKRRKDEQAARELKKQEAQLSTQRNLEELMAKTAARGRQQGRAFTGPMTGLWT